MIALAAWLAPIPLLVYCYQRGWLASLYCSLLVGLAPGLNQLVGYWATGLPISNSVYSMIAASVQFAIVVLISRWLYRCNRSWLAVLAFPVCMSLWEWILSLTSAGTFGTLAYSQLDFLPAAQIASLTGFYGITFVITLFASSIALMLDYYRNNNKQYLYGACVGLLLIGAALTYGYYRLDTNKPVQSVKVGLASIVRWPKLIYNPKQADRLSGEYGPLIARLAQHGAKIIILPEETVTVIRKNVTRIRHRYARYALSNHVYLIVGINQLPGNKRYNTAWLFAPSGQVIGRYHKRHFVPGVEDGITAGKQLVTFPFKTSSYDSLFAVAICRDMDYSNPALDYGKAGVGLLFVPAWDFTIDARVHAMGAFMRAIENGYSVARSSRNGLLSVTTANGRLLASIKTNSTVGNTLLVDAPVYRGGSFYARHNNGFVYVLFALFILIALLRKRTK